MGSYGTASSSEGAAWLPPLLAGLACVVLGFVGGLSYSSLHPPAPRVIEREVPFSAPSSELAADQADCTEMKRELLRVSAERDRLSVNLEALQERRAAARQRTATFAAPDEDEERDDDAASVTERMLSGGRPSNVRGGGPSRPGRAAAPHVLARSGPFVTVGGSGVNVTGSVRNYGSSGADVTVVVRLRKGVETVDEGTSYLWVEGGESADYAVSFRWFGEGSYSATVAVR